MRLCLRPSVFVFIALVGAAFVAACGGSGGPAKVQVTLAEWSISAPAELKPGRADFVVLNGGTRPHELVIIKTDFPVPMLPLSENKVDESKLHIVGKIEPFAAGATQTLTVSLSPGKYVLICNVLERPPAQPPLSHFDNGMAASFTVGP